jgi:hypothetical protein
VFAVDVTTWPRCDAECSPERGYYYHPSRHSAGQPIIAGWAFQWIAQLGFERDSWTAPVDAARLHPLDDTDHTAAVQVRTLLERLPAGGSVPWFVFDGGDDSAQLSLDLAEVPRGGAGAVAIRPLLLRRPATTATRQHGPAAPPWGQVQLRRLDHLAGPDRDPDLSGRPGRHRHRQGVDWAASQAAAPPGHGSGGPRPIVRGTILRVQVERVPAKTPPPKVPWSWWAGPGSRDLDLAWRAYVRRFDLEHTIRFAKQTLGWTTPRPRHPAQAERWTWLVLAAYAQLRLAREAAGDQRLPWEVPRPQPRPSPYRVRRGFLRLSCALGSPAATPKPCGCSPGRPKGRPGGACYPLPGDQEARQQASEEATHHHRGHLTSPFHHR